MRLTDRERLLRQVSEKEWTRQVIELARTTGWLAHHSRTSLTQGGRFMTALSGAPGLPDLILVRAPRVIFAELKRQAGGVLSAGQQDWQQELRRCPGIETYIWIPGDIEAVHGILRKPNS